MGRNEVTHKNRFMTTDEIKTESLNPTAGSHSDPRARPEVEGDTLASRPQPSSVVIVGGLIIIVLSAILGSTFVMIIGFLALLSGAGWAGFAYLKAPREVNPSPSAATPKEAFQSQPNPDMVHQGVPVVAVKPEPALVRESQAQEAKIPIGTTEPPGGSGTHVEEVAWFYAVGKQQQGPESQVRIIERIKAGEFTRATKVWSEGMAKWAPASQTELNSFFSSKVPPPLEEDETIASTQTESVPRPGASNHQCNSGIRLHALGQAFSGLISQVCHAAGSKGFFRMPFSSALKRRLQLGLLFALIMTTALVLWHEKKSNEPVSSWASSGPTPGYRLGETPGFPKPTAAQLSELQDTARATGTSEQELERLRVEASHMGKYLEDSPGGQNYREKERERSRQASGWYDSKPAK
jgi:hypothetical protein